MRIRTITRKAAAALAAATLLGAVLGGCASAPKYRSITLTFIRHGESVANADGVIDTSMPGPDLTEKGEEQARQIAHELGRHRHDGVYASNMLRARQTAAPFAKEIGRQVQVLPGLREIKAGWFEDKPASRADYTYLLAPIDWVHGDRADAIPGSIDGDKFNEEFTAAVHKIYESGDANPVAFSHAASIMTWTLMNVRNTPVGNFMTEHPLPNIGRVVVTGNPNNGWKLVDWDGIRDFN